MEFQATINWAIPKRAYKTGLSNTLSAYVKFADGHWHEFDMLYACIYGIGISRNIRVAYISSALNNNTELHQIRYYDTISGVELACNYRKTSNIRHTLLGNKIVDLSYVGCRRCSNYIFIVYLTHGFNGLPMTTARRDEKHSSFGIRCHLH